VALLAQTTLSVDEWQGVLTASRERFPDLWVPEHSDLCFATTNRQAAVKAVAGRADAVVVVGSANSSNACALARVAEACGVARVVMVDGPDELPADLGGTVAVTAGASTPESVVRAVVAQLAPVEGVEVVRAVHEEEHFALPPDLRELIRLGGLEPTAQAKTEPGES
jgi:4-hydroxy-3-methylbut-2-en-1-yl diphosphate reductase